MATRDQLERLSWRLASNTHGLELHRAETDYSSCLSPSLVWFFVLILDFLIVLGGRGIGGRGGGLFSVSEILAESSVTPILVQGFKGPESFVLQKPRNPIVGLERIELLAVPCGLQVPTNFRLLIPVIMAESGTGGCLHLRSQLAAKTQNMLFNRAPGFYWRRRICDMAYISNVPARTSSGRSAVGMQDGSMGALEIVDVDLRRSLLPSERSSGRLHVDFSGMTRRNKWAFCRSTGFLQKASATVPIFPELLKTTPPQKPEPVRRASSR